MVDTTVSPAQQKTQTLNLLKVLGPAHIWALGVGIVLVGEFMGWNYAVGKGGAFGALIAMLICGILYTCVAKINSEVTSTVASAGGQYAQAKHTIGPLMAFNVGLFMTFTYLMLNAGDILVAGQLVQIGAQELGHDIPWQPFTVLFLAVLTLLNYRGVLATLTVNFVITAAAFLSIIILFIGVKPWAPNEVLLAQGPVDCPSLWVDRSHSRVAFRHVVLSRHRGYMPSGRGGALAGPRAAARNHERNYHAADRRCDHLVRRLRPDAVGIYRLGCHARAAL